MPTRGSGQASITIKREYVDKLESTFGKVSAPLIYKLMDDALDYRNIRQMAPLQFLSALDQSILIRNRISGVIAELVIKEGELVCLLDRSKNCAHVGFAWATPEVYKVMKEHGAKKPQ